MPNVASYYGLRPLMQTLGGGCPVILPFKKAASYATALYVGDAVNQVADGTIEASATPGSTYYSGVNLTHGKASKETEHLVVVSADAVYVSRANGSLVEADAGLNANLQLGAGSNETLLSGHRINASTAATTASLDLKLLRLYPVEGNEPGNYAEFVVVFNKHRLHPAVAGV